jgi:hypothetical protein
MTRNRTSVNRAATLAACVTLGIASALLTGPARADLGSDDDAAWKARFDLGIDIGSAGRTNASIQEYLAALPPETQRAIMNGCEHYMLYPSSVQSPDTLPFCRVAVGVTVQTGSAKTKIIEFGAVPTAPVPRVYDQGSRPVFRLYPDDDENGHP